MLNFYFDQGYESDISIITDSSTESSSTESSSTESSSTESSSIENSTESISIDNDNYENIINDSELTNKENIKIIDELINCLDKFRNINQDYEDYQYYRKYQDNYFSGGRYCKENELLTVYEIIKILNNYYFYQNNESLFNTNLSAEDLLYEINDFEKKGYKIVPHTITSDINDIKQELIRLNKNKYKKIYNYKIVVHLVEPFNLYMNANTNVNDMQYDMLNFFFIHWNKCKKEYIKTKKIYEELFKQIKLFCIEKDMKKITNFIIEFKTKKNINW